MISSKEIIELFSYSKDEQDTFSYLQGYMKRISKKLPEIEGNQEKLKKFALAGLFLTYRAFNHTGSKLTTDNGDILSDSIHFKSLGAFKDYFGLEIKDTEHYFSMMNLTKINLLLMMFRLTDISRRLYYFVVK